MELDKPSRINCKSSLFIIQLLMTDMIKMHIMQSRLIMDNKIIMS